MIESFEQWCPSFAEEGVHFCVKPVSDHCMSLTPAEVDTVAEAVSIRRNTYSTGRACAKTALAKLNTPPEAYSNGLLRQADGSVAWPEGVIGSISHTNDWAIAGVARSHGSGASESSLVSIGIDIEKIDRVTSDVLRIIATEQEKEEIERCANLRWTRVALFSIKESLYKSLRPIYGEFIRFKDVQVTQFDRPANFVRASTMSSHDVEFFSPQIKLLSPPLSQCCNESNISVRLAVLPSHVLSYVSYKA